VTAIKTVSRVMTRSWQGDDDTGWGLVSRYEGVASDRRHTPDEPIPPRNERPTRREKLMMAAIPALFVIGLIAEALWF